MARADPAHEPVEHVVGASALSVAAARPVVPEPDLSDLGPVLGRVLEVPGADALELPTTATRVGAELAKKLL
jgi:hypothetical protein